ncbi:hypothetical protein BJ508DRAFT_336428 [Ascobolus immersus RN42]|uniref:Uncharacterized protein n=1 Tax=Ascobolus immersus RN42 TaxID=1160509 RepID=A0A3N4HG22_ASCIM|nr:hypothetical protein BJ508DRAFT_336428 [Ascobolus immersus RN42]
MTQSLVQSSSFGRQPHRRYRLSLTRDPLATPSGDEFDTTTHSVTPTRKSSSRKIQARSSRQFATRPVMSEAETETSDRRVGKRQKTANSSSTAVEQHEFPGASKRDLYKYCGLRTDDIAYLPIEQTDLASLFAHNPIPHLPRNPELVIVFNELELAWEEQLTQVLIAEDSDVTDAQISAYIQKKRRQGDFNPSEDNFVSACALRNASLSFYVIRDVAGLSQMNLDRLQLYVKNRMFLMLYFTKEHKCALIRDALGIDVQHLAWDYCMNLITNMRSSLQAKILARAHLYAVGFLTGNGYEPYAKKYAGQIKFEINPTTKKPDPRIPPASLLPSNLDDLAVAQDILRDIHEGVDWDAFWKVPDPKKLEAPKELNHFGRSIVMKCKAYVQAECLNGLDWCDPKTGVYRRPQTMEKGKKVDCPMDRCRIVKNFIRSIDTSIRPSRNCPREERAIAKMERKGITVDKNKPRRRVAFLYPLPRYSVHGRSRNGGDTLSDLHINTTNMLQFDDINPSDVEDDVHSDGDDDDV